MPHWANSLSDGRNRTRCALLVVSEFSS